MYTIRRGHIRNSHNKKVYVHRHPMKIPSKRMKSSKNNSDMKFHNNHKGDDFKNKAGIHKNKENLTEENIIPTYRNRLEKKYGKENVELIWMRPEKFLRHTTHPLKDYETCYGLIFDEEEANEILNKSVLNSIERSIRNSEPLTPLIIWRGKHNGIEKKNDGIHRAYTAHMLGIKQIPVFVVDLKDNIN